MAELNVHFDLRFGPRLLRGGLTALMLLAAAAELGSENVTLTTYYPAPTGIYAKMITTSDTVLARDGGAVTIGQAASSAVKLGVVGAVRIADGTQGSGRVLTSNASGTASWQAPAFVPAGAVTFFNLASCPSGWSAFASARGRYLVGGGALGAQVGTALSDQENRPAGRHSHMGWTANLGSPSSWNTVGAWMNRGLYPGPQGAYTITDGGEDDTGRALVPGTNAPYIQLLACYKL